MNTMLKLTLCLLAVAALVVPAAAEKGKPAPGFAGLGLLDCSGAIPIACGDVVSGDNTGLASTVDAYSCVGWNEAGGEVVYELVLDGEYTVTGTLSNLAADLDIFFLDGCDENACLAFGNVSFNTTVPAGTYYIVVDGYNGAQSAFDLAVTCDEVLPPPPALPGGETCDDAVDLQAGSLAQFSVDLTGYANDFTGADCFSWSTNGGDAVYKIYLNAGDTFTATQDGPCDMALYVMADCASGVALSCSDNCCSGATELVNFSAPADGWYYLIVDAYTSAGCEVVITIDAPVANEDRSFGEIKTMFR